MGLFGVGELSGVGLLAPNHMIALGLGGFVAVVLALKQLLLRQNQARWFIVIAGCLLAGALSAYLARITTIGTYRDTAAILLSLTLGLCCGAIFRHFGERAFFGATFGLSLLNVVILPVGFFLGEFPGMTVWYGDRFLGVSRNPNQTALFCVAGIIAAIRLRDLLQGSSPWIRRAVVLGALGNLMVGIASKSSAFRLAVIVTAVGFVAGVFFKRRTSPALRGFAATTFLLACLTLLLLHPSAALVRTVEEDGSLVRNDNQLDYRFQLWNESISLVGQFPIFGRGGGAAGGTFDIQLEYDAMEAHNTLIDLTIATGLVGLVTFVAKICFNMSRLWRANLMVELALVSFLFTFAMFHNLSRQPLFWMLIAAFEIWPERGVRRFALPFRRPELAPRKRLLPVRL